MANGPAAAADATHGGSRRGAEPGLAPTYPAARPDLLILRPEPATADNAHPVGDESFPTRKRHPINVLSALRDCDEARGLHVHDDLWIEGGEPRAGRVPVAGPDPKGVRRDWQVRGGQI